MAYIPVLNDILEQRMYCYVGNQVSCNTIHYKVTGTAGPGVTQATILSTLDTQFATPLKTILGNLATYYGNSLQKIWPLPRVTHDNTTASSGVGTGGAVLLPTQVTAILSLYGALAGKTNRGRFYVPFPSAVWNQGAGVCSTAYVTAASVVGGLLIAPTTVVSGGSSATVTPVIWNRTLHTTSVPTSVNIEDVWATQKRRGYFGRLNRLPF